MNDLANIIIILVNLFLLFLGVGFLLGGSVVGCGIMIASIISSMVYLIILDMKGINIWNVL